MIIMKRVIFTLLIIAAGINTAIAAQCEQEPTVSGTTTICYGSGTILTATGGSDGNGADYQWGTGTCGEILGQTGSTYTVSPTETTTYWVRRIGTGVCSNTTTDCASLTITVNSTPPTPPTGISGTNTICSGGNTTLTATGGSGSTTYRWGTGATIGSGVISGATGASYTTPNLTSNTTYWVQIQGTGACSANYYGTATQQVTVHKQFTAGSIETAGQTACLNATATTIGSATIASGGDGNITYQWKKTGTVIAATNATTYTPPTNEAGTFFYTREAKDGTCNPAWAASGGAWILTVLPAFSAGSISTTGQTICFNTPAIANRRAKNRKTRANFLFRIIDTTPT
jgi:hypothetical protein